MNIIFSEERMPGEVVVNHMNQAGALCVQEEGLDPQTITVSVTFVSTEEIKELNRVYRNKDAVTDVLSFPQFEDLNEVKEAEEVCLGDVVICPEQALLQADEYGHSGERELVYLFVHSMFHLLGYDHMNEEEKTEMRKQEEKIMNQIGLGR
ncbi:rRNA maturation RNase YbeY [Sinanaerobacter sp. ZZT-01]|uniref:rRNA maturation RNase YbeY n=1 Tax=Sinanaerobacter sp. ZZT-01 TaxID=3111540 RepID=UPI002D7A0FD6|nr:rRNA maturation RNase YbeY [Sinanaerobacter sp. ZZT-01]WRR92883.1 rRNA maturation RNase YbeY [Sinanaerobacter sp. ZZT-01]